VFDTATTSIGIFGGDLGNGTLFYPLDSPGWSSSTLPTMLTSHFAYPAAALCGGDIYVAGGSTNGQTALSSAAERFALKNFQWTSIAKLSTERALTAGTCLNDGKTFLVCGGHSSAHLSSCEKFNTATTSGSWVPAANMSIPRIGYAMVLYNGNAIALGGFSTATKLNSAEQYDSASNKWSSFPPFTIPRFIFGGAVVLSKIYIVGGFNGSTIFQSVEVFDGTSWSFLSSGLPSGLREGHAVVLSTVSLLS
jgi:N-acetylneuraminic acid mutarotase